MNISIMLKPSSSLCNLNCKYCFYHSLASSRQCAFCGMMSDEVLSSTLQKAFAFARGDRVMLSFQGGEPLLSGKEFFAKVHQYIRQYNTHNSPVSIAVQTNGTLIDEQWCKIFRRGGYLIGLSLDGDEQANRFRVDSEGKPTFDRVLNAAKLLKKHHVDFNILSVVTKPNAKRMEQIYTFFKREGFGFLQFIPMLKPLALDEQGRAVDGRNSAPFVVDGEDISLDCNDYYRFLRTCFELYAKDFEKGRYVSVRQFDNLVRIAHGEQGEQCGSMGHCCHQFVVEGDGRVYPCDFYCLDAYALGNITKDETDFFKLSVHPTAVQFIKESMVRSKECEECKFFDLCRNGCKRERIDLDKCEAMKKFLQYALPTLKILG